MMRMLNEFEARNVFQFARVGRLGCIVNGEPYVVPISCHLENDCLYSHSLPGLKISALRENPRACVQVDEIESDLHWRSAIAFGKFEEITKSTEREEALASLLRKFPMLTPVESAIVADASVPQLLSFGSGLSACQELPKDKTRRLGLRGSNNGEEGIIEQFQNWQQLCGVCAFLRALFAGSVPIR